MFTNLGQQIQFVSRDNNLVAKLLAFVYSVNILRENREASNKQKKEKYSSFHFLVKKV
jgi:hypothetical protein